jgi:hypothetical protein
MNRPILLVPLVLLFLDYAIAVHWSNANVPKSNLTIEAAKGTSQHGSNRILCYPLTWPSLAMFYLENFGAHIATVQSTPGDKWPLTLFNMVLALFFPTSGLMRGLNAIVRNFSSSIFARKVVAKILRIKRWRRDETSLEKACKAGALCIVVRNANWRPNPGQVNIPAILSALSRDADPEQPSPKPGFPDVEAAWLVANPNEDNDVANAAEASGDEVSECSTANLNPKGNVQRPDMIMFFELTCTRDNPHCLSTNVAQRNSERLVDLFRHFVEPKYRRPYLESYSWKLQAPSWLFICNYPSQCNRASRAQLQRN